MADARLYGRPNRPKPAPDQGGTLQNPQSGKTLRADHPARSAEQAALQRLFRKKTIFMVWIIALPLNFELLTPIRRAIPDGH